MTHQQQLVNIIESGKEKAILSFLKNLSTAERKALVPALKKHNKYYNHYVEIKPGSWSIRGTEAQRKTLRIAGYLCYNQKEFTKLVGGFDPELLDPIMEFYTPSWLSTYVNSFSSNEWIPHTLSYLWMVKNTEEGIIQPEPTLIAKQLCEVIYKSTPLKRDWTYSPKRLEIYDVTLQEHFWLLFKYETNVYHADRWKYFGGKRKENYNWTKTIVELERTNKLPRKRLLKEALQATTQNFNRNLINWYIDLFIALQPTEEELLELQTNLFAAFHSSQTKPINTVLKYCKSIVKSPKFNASAFLEFGIKLLSSETKSIIKSSLILLDKIAKKQPDLQTQICQITCTAFAHTDEAIQIRAAKIITKYGAPEDPTLTAELQLYVGQLKSEPTSILTGFIRPVLETTEEPFVLYEKEIPIKVDNQLPIIQHTDDLIFLLSQSLDGNKAWHLEAVLAALIDFHPQMNVAIVDKLAPIFQRAYKMLYRHQWNKRQGNTDYLLAIFLSEYMELLMKQFDTQQLRNLKQDQKAKEQGKAKRWSWYKSPKVRLQSWRVSYNYHLYIPIRDLLIGTLNKLKQGDLLPLLSTPTHVPCWLDPVAYVQRLSQYQQGNQLPNAMDWQIAISRIALDDTSAAIQLAKDQLQGEYLEMTLYLFDQTITDLRIQQFPEEWTVCAYTKHPKSLTNILPVVSSQKEQQTFLGEVPYQFTKKKVKIDRYDYKTSKYKKVEVENARLQIGYSEKPNLLQKLYKLVLSKTKRHGILHQYMTYNDWYLQLAGMDTIRLLYLMPNNVQPLLRTLCKAMYHRPDYFGEEDKRRIIKTTEALLQIGQGSGTMSHLFIANTLMGPEKAARILAAEVILKGICEDTIQLNLLGKIVGESIAVNYFPIKRFTDILSDHMLNISIKHNQALEEIFTALIKELPATPIRGTKQLLSIYKELRASNSPRVLDTSIQEKLATWQNSPSLKKLSGQLMAIQKVA